MQILHRGFDGLDVAFAAQIPCDLSELLDEAKDRANSEMTPQLVEYQGVKMHVAETGARGGYAFRCDTGPDGATWFFKRPNPRDDWGIRVSAKSLALASYQYAGVKQQLRNFLTSLGVRLQNGSESVGRVDFAIDILAPNFELRPDRIVSHWHFARRSHGDLRDYMVDNVAGRYTGLRVGSMPGRQIAIYDKRLEVIQKHKKEWFEIWNQTLRQSTRAVMDFKDSAARVWRFEFRAGRAYLRKPWNIRSFDNLEDRLGNLFSHTAKEIRLTLPTADSNRSRWPTEPIWKLVQSELAKSLCEMTALVDAQQVRDVNLAERRDILASHLIGLVASWGAIGGYECPERIIDEAASFLRFSIRRDPDAFLQKLTKAKDRYAFYCYGANVGPYRLQD